MSNQFKRNPRQLLNGLKLQLQQALRDLSITLASAWRHKNLGHIWYITVHCIGVVGYTAFSLSAAITLFIVFLLVSFVVDDINKSSAMKPAHGTALPFNPLQLLGWMVQAVFMMLFRIFGGFMGWGAKNTEPMHVPGHILGSIPKHVQPNRTTQFFGYLTLILITGYIAQLLFLVYGGI